MALNQQDKLDISTIVTEVVTGAVKDLPTRTEVHSMIGEAVKDLPTRVEVHQMIGEAVKDFPTRMEMHQFVDEATESLAQDVAQGFSGVDAQFRRVNEHFNLVENRLSELERGNLEIKFLLTDVVHRGEFLGLETRVDQLERRSSPE